MALGPETLVAPAGGLGPETPVTTQPVPISPAGEAAATSTLGPETLVTAPRLLGPETIIPQSDRAYLDRQAAMLDLTLAPMTRKTWKDAFKNVAQSPLSYLPYLNAVDIITTGKQLANAHDLMDGKATPEQKADLEDFLRKQNTPTTIGHDVWNVVLRLPSYAIEFFTAGGVIKAIGKRGLMAGAEEALNVAGQKVAKETVEQVAQEIGKRALEKGSAEKAVTKIFAYLAKPTAVEGAEAAVSGLLKTVAKEGVESAAGQAAMKTAKKGLVEAGTRAVVEAPIRAVLSPQRIILDAQNYLTPKLGLTQDDQGKVQAILEKSDDDFLSAFAKGFANQSIENLSESVGPQLTYLAGVAGRSFPALAKSVVLNRLLSPVYDPAKKSRILTTILRSGWSGVLPEMYEERVGDVLRFATGLQPNLFPTVRQLVTEAIAFTIPGVTAQAATGGFEAALGNPYGERAQRTTAALKRIETSRKLGVLSAPQVDTLVANVEKAVKADDEKGLFGMQKLGSLTRQLTSNMFKDKFDTKFFNPEKLKQAVASSSLRQYLLDYMGVPENRVISVEDYQRLMPAFEDESLGIAYKDTHNPLWVGDHSFMTIDDEAAQKHGIQDLVDKLNLTRVIRSVDAFNKRKVDLILNPDLNEDFAEGPQSGIEQVHRERVKNIITAIKADGKKIVLMRPVILALTPSEYEAIGYAPEETDVGTGATRNGEPVLYKSLRGAHRAGELIITPDASARDLVEEFIHSKDQPGTELQDFRDNVWLPAVRAALSPLAAEEIAKQRADQRQAKLESLKQQIEKINELRKDKAKVQAVEESRLAGLQQQVNALTQEGLDEQLAAQQERLEDRVRRLTSQQNDTPEAWMNATKLLRLLDIRDKDGHYTHRAELFAKAVTNHLGWPYREESLFNHLNLGAANGNLALESERHLKNVFGKAMSALRMGRSRATSFQPEIAPEAVSRPATAEEIASYAEDLNLVEDRPESDTDLLSFSLVNVAQHARAADPALFRVDTALPNRSRQELAYTHPEVPGHPAVEKQGDLWFIVHNGLRDLLAFSRTVPSPEEVRMGYVRMLQKTAADVGRGTMKIADVDQFLGPELFQKVLASRVATHVPGAPATTEQASRQLAGTERKRPEPTIVPGGPSIAQANREGAIGERMETRARRGDEKAARELARQDRARTAGERGVPFRPSREGVGRTGREAALRFQPILERPQEEFDQELVPEYASEEGLYDRNELMTALPSWLLENADATDYAITLLSTGYSPYQVMDRLLNETDYLDTDRIEKIINGTIKPTMEQARPFKARDLGPNPLQDMINDLVAGYAFMKRSIPRYRGQSKAQLDRGLLNPLRVESTTAPLNEAMTGERRGERYDEATQEAIDKIEAFYEEAEAPDLTNMTPSEIRMAADMLDNEQPTVVDTEAQQGQEDVNTISGHRGMALLDPTVSLASQLQAIYVGGETAYLDILPRKGTTLRSNLFPVLARANPLLPSNERSPFLFTAMTKRKPLPPTAFDKLHSKVRSLVDASDGVIVFFNPLLDEFYGLPLQRAINYAQTGRYAFAQVPRRRLEKGEFEAMEPAEALDWLNLDPIRAQLDQPIANVRRGYGEGYRAILVLPTNLNFKQGELQKAIQAWMLANRVRTLGIIGLEKGVATGTTPEAGPIYQTFLPALRDALTIPPPSDIASFDFNAAVDPVEHAELNAWFKAQTPENAYGPYSLAARSQLRRLTGQPSEASLKPRVGPISVTKVTTATPSTIEAPLGAEDVQIDKSFAVRLGPVEGVARISKTRNGRLLELDPAGLKTAFNLSKKQDEAAFVRTFLARKIVRTTMTQKQGESDASFQSRVHQSANDLLAAESRNPGRSSVFGERFRKVLQLYQQHTSTQFSLQPVIVEATKDGQGRPNYTLASKLLRGLTDGREEARAKQAWALDYLIKYDRKNADLYRAVAGRAQKLQRQVPNETQFSLESIDRMITQSPWRAQAGAQGVHELTIKATRLKAVQAQGAWLRSQSWRTRVPDPRVQDAITHAREGDAAALQIVKDAGAEDVLQEYGAELDRQFEELQKTSEEWNEQGWIRFYQNYVPHYWKSNNGKPVKENMQHWRMDTGRTKGRVFPTIVEGKKYGLVPVTENAFDLYDRYVHDIWGAAVNRYFIHSLLQMTDVDGQPMMVPVTGPAVQPPNESYVRRESPFRDFDSFWVHPEAVFGFDMLFQEKWSNRFLDVIEHWNQWTKFLALSLSLFHHFSLTESLVALTAKRWLEDAMKARTMKEAWESPFNSLRIVRRAANGSLLREMMAQPDLVELALRHGLTVGLNPNVEMGIIDRDLDIAYDWAKRHNLPLAEGIIDGFRGLKNWNNRKLWMEGQSAVKLYVFHMLSERLITNAQQRGQEVDPDLIREELAKFMNAGFGGQEWAQLRWATPRVRQLMHLFIFAPDWTWSNLNIAGIPAFFGQKYSKEEIKLAMQDYWPAMLLTITALPAAFQAAVYGAFGDPDKDNPWMFANEQGKRSYVDVTPIVRGMDRIFGKGWMGPGGNQRWYLRYGKQAWEIVDWMEEPYRTLMGKTSMAFKTAFEQVTGTNTSGWELPFKDMSFWESMYTGERPKAVVEKLLPMSIQTLLEGRPSTFFAPLSKGMTRGKAVQLMSEILEKYADPDAWPNLARVKDHRTRLIEVVGDVADAAEKNGYDPAELVASAKRNVLGGLYETFWKQINAQDLAGAERTAESIVRMGGVLDGVNRSMERKYGTVGLPYEPDTRLQIADVFRAGEADQGVDATLTQEERRVMKTLSKGYTAPPIVPLADEPFVVPTE